MSMGYHHMTEHGYYCGWTSWKLIVTPPFGGIDLDLELVSNDADFESVDEETGETYDGSEFDIESTDEYLGELYRHALGETVVHDYDHESKRVFYRREVRETA